jgi:hypothetical protein
MHQKPSSLMGHRPRLYFLAWWRGVLCGFWCMVSTSMGALLVTFTARMCLSKCVTTPFFISTVFRSQFLLQFAKNSRQLDTRQALLLVHSLWCSLGGQFLVAIITSSLRPSLFLSDHIITLLMWVQEVLFKKGCVWHYVQYDRRPEFAQVGLHQGFASKSSMT